MGSACAGLDVDKMDYLCRDQVYTDIVQPELECAFRTADDVDRLLEHARIVSAVRHGRKRTEIAFKVRGAHQNSSLQPTDCATGGNTDDECVIKLLDGLFRARAAMHEVCYQSVYDPAALAWSGFIAAS